MWMPPSSRLRRVILVGALAGIVLSACAGGRPTFDEWLPLWEHAVGAIPTEEVVVSATSQALCESTLADLRVHQGSLVPTPRDSIDDTVRDWIEVAERIFFECPPVGGFSQSYAELRRLATEIDAVIALEATG